MEVWQKATVDIIGPFVEHRVVIDGREVPFLTVKPMQGGMLHVTVDHRSSIDLSVADAEHVLPWAADCIAVALGYTQFPRDDMPDAFTRKHFPRVHSIGSVESEVVPEKETP